MIPQRTPVKIALELFPDQYWCNKCGAISTTRHHEKCDYNGILLDYSECRSKVTAAIESERSRALADVAELEARLMASEKWICFHCGFETSDRDEAHAHFGDRDDAEEFTPTCTWWAKLTAEERAQEIQDLLQQITAEQNDNGLLRSQIEGLEHQAKGQLHEIQGFKAFSKCTSVTEVFQLYDSMEGRALLAEQDVVELVNALRECDWMLGGVPHKTNSDIHKIVISALAKHSATTSI